MITRELLIELDIAYSELTIARVHHEAATKTFQKEHEEIRKLLEKGQTTGDPILDWALEGEYPYRERAKSARTVYNYLEEHVGDYFFFLDFGRYCKLHLGKIAAPPLHLAERTLHINVEEGTLVEKDVSFYQTQPPLIHRHHAERSQPFIEGLLLDQYRHEEGVLESTHGLFTSDDFHYVLGAGKGNVLAYLHGKKIIPKSTQECLDELLSK